MVDNELESIEEYAKLNNVPIMQKDGIEYVVKFIKDNNIKNILEIGTAIGYSAIKMALVDNSIQITTIERDINRIEVAKENIKKLDLKEQITIIDEDASNVEIDEMFDLVLIDASKAQNKNFFIKFSKNLKKQGYIITDNLYFHGYVFKELEDIESKNIRGLVRKIKDYVEFLKNNKDYDTKFLDIGDGLSVSTKI